MKKILISYGTSDFIDTLKRLRKEAQSLKIFDKIILYGPKDLPNSVKSNPLMTFRKGGGYWIWKPYVIWKTLQEFKDSVVIYVDAGCSINSSLDWNYYFNKIENFNTIVFNYRNDFDYKWHGYKNTSTKIKHWSKRETLEYFDKLFINKEWRDFNKIMGGFIICKSNNNIFVKEWLQISLLKPELIFDPFGIETVSQDSLYSEHRHDQCIITPLSYFFSLSLKNEVLILPETSESMPDSGAVGANRIKYLNGNIVLLKTKLIQFAKSIIGERLYNKVTFRS